MLKIIKGRRLLHICDGVQLKASKFFFLHDLFLVCFGVPSSFEDPRKSFREI